MERRTAKRLSFLARNSQFFGVVFFTLACVSFAGFFASQPVFAVAKQSSISVSVSSNLLSVDIVPSIEGTFAKSAGADVSIKTNNFTGYTLRISAENTTDLVKDADNIIGSISSEVSENDFISNGDYNNKWGFLPSKYVKTENGIDSTVQNTNYLPAPSTSGMLIDSTNVANDSYNVYTLAFGAKANYELSAGTYDNTLVITAVGNPVGYVINYDENTADTVSDMPSPNPQTGSVDGGAPEEDSYAVLSENKPVRNDKMFAGWCDQTTTKDQETGDDICPGTIYHEGDEFPIDQIEGTDVTIYAIWVDTLFPIVWNQMGACEFHGATNGNITGSECSKYADVKFIDTGVPLYNQENFPKDYEIHFTIDSYDPANQVDYFGSEDGGQQTFANEKLSTTAGDGKAPGVVVRRTNDDKIEINSKINNEKKSQAFDYAEVQDVSVFRLDNNMYYSINNSPLVLLQNNIESFNKFFGLTTWFGGYPRDDCTGNDGPCTNAKRIPEATLSNMYIRLGEYSDDDIYNIVFNANGGTPGETNYLIKAGNSIVTLPEGPSYADHIFQGWFTAQTGGDEVIASTIPTASANYYAHWLGTVAIADITTTQIALQPGGSETIAIENSSELEPYTFSSDHHGVATVNENTGEVTAVAAGTANITITGTISGETKTVPVTVSGQVYQVYFDSQGGSAISPNPIEVGDGGTIDPLPTSIKANSEFDGWYTAPDGAGTKLTTTTIFNSSTPTQYYANWKEASYVCKPATTLHTETCSRTNSSGCRGAGYANGDTITYGSLVQQGATGLAAGNAMTCDINADGMFDEANERFYYLTNVGNNAALIYYKNISNAEDSYTDGIALLPTSSTPGWTNTNLVGFSSGEFAGKVTRYMSYDEARATCNNSTSGLGSNGKCLYILEASNFAYSNIRDGYWVTSTNNSRVHTSSRSITSNSKLNGVRPVIEVPSEYVSIHVQRLFTVAFDPHNEASTTFVTVDEGDSLGTKIPADPIYADHLFQGWFTAAVGGTPIGATTVPTNDTTYHAQWLKTVALAELARDTIAVEPGGTAPIVVTNSSELESYTFSTSDDQIATVDPTTGEITGVAKGSTTITMTGSTSGATKTITVNVTALLPVTQATIGNTDLTTTVGREIAVIVTNSAELEPYTFSSADTSIATVNDAGVITGVSAGTTNIIMTGTSSGLTKTLEVDIVAVPATIYTVTFNPSGGSFSDLNDGSKQVEEGAVVGALPTPTKANYMFLGWYKDDGTFYDEVYPDEVITSDVTYYAKWIENTTSFPVVWSEANKCTFNGTSEITGEYCTQDTTKSYIDTAIKLFSEENYQKDFEVGFNIVEYDSTKSVNQATLVNSKAENLSNWPGFTMRKKDASNFELTERFSMSNTSVATPGVASASLKQVRIARIDQKIYYSWNGADYVLLQDIKANTTRFDTNVWFGAAINSSGNGPQEVRP